MIDPRVIIVLVLFIVLPVADACRRWHRGANYRHLKKHHWDDPIVRGTLVDTGRFFELQAYHFTLPILGVIMLSI